MTVRFCDESMRVLGEKKICTKCGKDRAKSFYRVIGWNLPEALCRTCDGNIRAPSRGFTKLTVAEKAEVGILSDKAMKNKIATKGTVESCFHCKCTFYALPGETVCRNCKEADYKTFGVKKQYRSTDGADDDSSV